MHNFNSTHRSTAKRGLTANRGLTAKKTLAVTKQIRSPFNRIFACAIGLSISWHSIAAPVFINEFHYDNSGSDIDEGVEIAGLAGTSLDDWTLLFYNGSNGEVYKVQNLSGTISDSENGFGVLNFFISGLQNGPNDGIALVDNHAAVLEFLSYEGPLLASEGAAAGMTSIDVEIEEPTSLESGFSIQRTGIGVTGSDFEWTLDTSTFGAINNSQQFASAVPVPAALPLFLTGLCGLMGSRIRHNRKG